MIINHNLPAKTANLQFDRNMFAAKSSLEKLSSGMRINRAGDDAAGLTISEKLKTQVLGAKRAIGNAQDDISLLQTAEGALSSTEGMLQRMRELAVQASNDIYTEQDRALFTNEYNALSAEVNRIAGQSEFNTQKLLDGSFNDKVFHISPNEDGGEGQSVTVSIEGMSTAELGLDGISPATQKSANSLIEAVDSAINYVSSSRAKVGALQNRLDYSISNNEIYSVNASASESRIRDTVTSSEMMEYIKYSLLMKASNAMEVHANQSPQTVLSLLR